jgi:hypothetical protein
MSEHRDGTGDAPAMTHPEEIRTECEIRIGEKTVMRAAARITPAGLVCTGLMVAAILLSTAALVRAARLSGPR